jgi:glutathione S-transferase
LKQVSEELGLPTNDLDLDDPPRHKVPIIHDASTGQFVSDSTRILAYLDKTYPQTPSILTPGTEAAAVAFDDAVLANMLHPLYPSIGARFTRSLDAEKTAGYRGFMEKMIGMTIEEYLANPELEEKHLKSAEEGFGVVNTIFKKAEMIQGAGAEGNGRNLTFADVSAGSILLYIRVCWWDNEANWKRLMAWDGGRWARLYETLLPYAVVPEQ